MYYAWDKEGKQHFFHHKIDQMTVIRNKGFTMHPLGEPEPVILAAAEGEKIEGMEIASATRREENLNISEAKADLTAARETDAVLGKGRKKIER